jgi:LuxR family maltose regulon positive regulatory protein
MVAPLLARLLVVQAPGGDPIFGDHLQRLAAALGVSASGEEDAAGAPALDMLAEPLTRKEIRVLQLLAEGYSNTAMAEKLFVSDSTVRTHLRNINTKLDSRSRTQAVAVARRLGLIR